MVAVMAVVALIALIAAPRYDARSGPQNLKATAFELAGLLRQSRIAAIRNGAPQNFRLDTFERRAWSARGGSGVVSANDITLRHQVSSRGGRSEQAIEVIFQPNGKSCGSVITLELGQNSATISTNWLTGATRVEFSGQAFAGSG